MCTPALASTFFTPTLALTSLAGATPPEWEVIYWTRTFSRALRLSIRSHRLSRHRPFDVCGAAYEWQPAYRPWLLHCHGGCTFLSCPDEVAPHADIFAIGEGVQTSGTNLDDIAAAAPVYRGDFRTPLDDPAHPTHYFAPE